MEGITKKQSYNVSSNPPQLAMHRTSQTISKAKPKIRIIHVFAPEIIKTDVENFRELVQRLTGKPTEKPTKKRPTNVSRRGSHHQNQKNISLCDHQVISKKMELRNGFGIKEEENMWINGANSGEFLSGFSEIDGFIQDLGEFPPSMMPTAMETNHHLQLHGFEEAQVLV